MSQNLYQLAGLQNLQPGQPVEVLAPNDRWGTVVKVISKLIELPNPCVVDGPAFIKNAPLSLYLIRGRGFEKPSNYAAPVWGFTS